MTLRLNLFLVIALLALGRISASAEDFWHVSRSPVVISEDLQFTNGDAQLFGTVYLPEHGDHLPAVVVLHDASIPSRRAALYQHLADGLPAMGIAVLIYDRRATGQSSGSRESANLTTLADDGIAGQRALSRIKRIDPNRVGFWGLSQGGWLAILAAVRSPHAAFAISVSAPLVTPEEQMRFAMSNLMEIRGFHQAEILQMLDTRQAWANYVHGETSRTVAVAALEKAQAQPWFDLVYLPKPSQLPSEDRVSASSSDKDYDPLATATKALMPLLFLYGDSDPWVPVASSVVHLQSLTQHVTNIEYAVIAGANHEMMIPVNDTMEINSDTIQKNAPQAPSYFMLLASWLSRHIATR